MEEKKDIVEICNELFDLTGQIGYFLLAQGIENAKEDNIENTQYDDEEEKG